MSQIQDESQTARQRQQAFVAFENQFMDCFSLLVLDPAVPFVFIGLDCTTYKIQLISNFEGIKYHCGQIEPKKKTGYKDKTELISYESLT